MSVPTPEEPADGSDVQRAGPAENAGSARGWQLPALVLLMGSAVLLLARLGHYPLWGDEADTAIYGRSIANTGDLNAVQGHNIYAFRNGTVLKNLKQRYAPPLPYALAGVTIGREGTDSLRARLPFALCGLASVALAVWWLRRERAGPLVWWLFTLAILGNVSFFLFARNSRYYALSTLLSMAIVYCYLNWNGRRWMLVLMAILSVLLFATFYLAHVALYAVLAVDYLVFRRGRQALGWREWLIVLGPQIAIGLAVLAVWNPLGVKNWEESGNRNWIADKLQLFWWHLRDMNACEFGAGLVLIIAPLLYLREKNAWLLRAPLAIVVYALAAAVLSPQPVEITSVADIRYLSAIIPLWIFLTVQVALALSRGRSAGAVLFVLLACGLNVLQHPLAPRTWRSTPWSMARELWVARPTAMGLASDWVAKHVKPGQSVWVMPDHFTYPLMYHQPHAVYAWQLQPPPREEFRQLPPIHFLGTKAVDYMIAFGPSRELVERVIAKYEKAGIQYKEVARLDSFWDDRTRPEMFWRSFVSLDGRGFRRSQDAVYVYARVKSAPAATSSSVHK